MVLDTGVIAAPTATRPEVAVVLHAAPSVAQALRRSLEGDAGTSVLAAATDAGSVARAVAGSRSALAVVVLVHGAERLPLPLVVDAGGRPPMALAVLDRPERAEVAAALDSGARGVVLVDTPPALLQHSVRSVIDGTRPADPRVSGAVADWIAERVVPRLTAREEEVLALVCAGLLNKQIARTLSITTATVKAHLTRLYGRLGVDDRAAAAAWALAQRSGPADAGA